MHNIPAVILAGGKSSRMGQDKALLPFGNEKTLSYFQYKKLSQLFETVYLSAKENKFDFECNYIQDKEKKSSPLVALVSLFMTLAEDAIFVISVDAPLIHAEIIQTLIDAYHTYPQYDAIIAQTPTRIQPLCGIYRRDIIPLAKVSLREKKHRLTDLLSSAHTKLIMFHSEKPFTNLNTYEAYQSLMKSAL